MPNYRPPGQTYDCLKRERDELAHALYTVAKHHGAQHPGSSLIKDRIRGAASTVPWLLDRFPDLIDALAVDNDA